MGDPSSFEISVIIPQELKDRFVKLADFKGYAKPAVKAALNEFFQVERSRIKGGHSGGNSAAGSVGSRTWSDDKGVSGKVGPRGKSHRDGYLAALFLETGTGVYGPRHAEIDARGNSAKNAGRAAEGREPLKLAMMFPSQMQVESRFGGRASIFTKTGKQTVRSQKMYGTAGMAIVKSTRGMPAQPWFAESERSGHGRAQEAFSNAIHQALTTSVK
jgi:hypothetical protein